jgi:hypothetical protein
MLDEHRGDFVHERAGILLPDGYEHLFQQLDSNLLSRLRQYVFAGYDQHRHVRSDRSFRRRQQLLLYGDSEL